MGSALYISIKNSPQVLDTMRSGKALAKSWEALDAVVGEIGILPITKLCNSSWKAPEKGLPVFQKYLEYVAEHQADIPDASELIEDLKDVLRLIGEAEKLGTKWRLMLDYCPLTTKVNRTNSGSHSPRINVCLVPFILQRLDLK